MKNLFIAGLIAAGTIAAASHPQQQPEAPPALLQRRQREQHLSRKHAAHDEAAAAAHLQSSNVKAAELRRIRSIDAKIGLNTQNADYKYGVTLVPSFPFNVTAGGGATLSADATYPTPDPANPNEKFPVIFFPNSWGIPEFEYILKILNISTAGYVCVEYQTRGWWGATGLINTAGPFDRSDGSELIDFILNTYGDAWNIDKNKIAFGGISYGAGISLEMAGYDSRVKTAMAMSGWGNILTAMYENSTPSKSSLDTLLGSAQAVGKPSPDLFTLRDNLLQHKNLDVVRSFASERSPATFLPTLKARNVPIFMSNNYLDRFFSPQNAVNFWDQLEVTNKFLVLNNGPHAIAEILGLANIQDYPWTKGQEWLDAVLKGIDNGILSEPRVQMQHGDSIFSYDFKMSNEVPPPYVGLTLAPRGGSVAGALEGSFANTNSNKAAKSVRVGAKSNVIRTLEVTLKQMAAAGLLKPEMTLAEARELILKRIDPKTGKMRLEAAAEALLAREKEELSREFSAAIGAAVARVQAEAEQRGLMRGQSALNSVGDNAGLKACLPTTTLAAADRADDKLALSNTINYSTNVTLKRGGDIWRALGVADKYPLGNVDPSTTLVFTSSPLPATSTLCGFPMLRNVTVVPKLRSTGAPSPNFQVYFYMYSVDSGCTGSIISDAVFTRWSDETQPAVNPRTGAYTIANLQMRAICTDIPAGNRVALGAVLFSENFQPATDDLTVTFDYTANPTLDLPFQ